MRAPGTHFPAWRRCPFEVKYGAPGTLAMKLAGGMELPEELLARYPAPLKRRSGEDRGCKRRCRRQRRHAASGAIYDSGRVVGRVEIERSYREALYATGAVTLLCLLLGALTYAILRTLPLRTLRQVTAELHLEKQK